MSTVFQRTLDVRTTGRGFSDVTPQIDAVVKSSKVQTGIVSVTILHTSASLVVQENADPAVLRDLARWLETLAPESASYEHDEEGPDDMPSHLRSAVTKTTETLPVQG